MNKLTRLEQFYYDAKGNRWFHYFTIFCRVALALGFIPSGIVKIMNERFHSKNSTSGCNSLFPSYPEHLYSGLCYPVWRHPYHNADVNGKHIPAMLGLW